MLEDLKGTSPQELSLNFLLFYKIDLLKGKAKLNPFLKD